MDQIDMTPPPMPPAGGFDPDAPELFTTPPKWPKVVGILSIVFGGFAFTCVGIGSMFAGLGGKMMEPMLEGTPMPPTMVFGAIDWALVAAGILLNLALIVAGVLTAMRNYGGRVVHLLYAVAMIPMLFVQSWSQMQKFAALEQWLIDYPDNPFAQQTIQQQQTMPFDMNLVGLVVGVAIGLAWPVFCLIWFGLVKTKKHQFTGEAEADAVFAM